MTIALSHIRSTATPSNDAADVMLLNERRAATLLGISPRKLFDLAKSGDVPALRVGGSKRYDRRDLIAYIERLKLRRR